MSTTEHQVAGGAGRRTSDTGDDDPGRDSPAEAPSPRSSDTTCRLRADGGHERLQAAQGRRRPRHDQVVDQARLPDRQVAQGPLPRRPHPVLPGSGPPVADPPAPERRHRQLAGRPPHGSPAFLRLLDSGPGRHRRPSPAISHARRCSKWRTTSSTTCATPSTST